MSRSKQNGDETRRWNVLMTQKIGLNTKFTTVNSARDRSHSQKPGVSLISTDIRECASSYI